MGGCTKSSPAVRSAAATRQAILDAARRQFARESYDNVGVRDIAGQVGVDPSLIIRYFGSKEDLFREVLESGKPGAFWDGVDGQALPAHLASFIMESEEDSEEESAKMERLLIILRSASSSKASAIVHDAMDDFILQPIASLLDAPDGRLRACLALSVLMGSGIFRQVMQAKPICDASDPTLRRSLEALFETALAPIERHST